jgi:hypothetical protein
MENPTFIEVSLSNVRVIMVIMRVLVVELLCQVVTGWVLVPKGLLPGAPGYQWLRPILSSIKWPHFSRVPTLRSHAQY